MSARNGEPCIKCGANEWKKCGDCAPCARERDRKYREANKDKLRKYFREHYRKNRSRILARHQEYYLENQDEIRAKQKKRYYENREEILIKQRARLKRDGHKHLPTKRRWKRNNPEKTRRYRQKWRENNRERARAHVRNRRAMRSNAPGQGVSPEEWKSILDHYGNRCLRCGSTDDITMDHVVPLIAGGAHSASNVQPLCLSCNCSKHDKTIDYRDKPLPKRWQQLELFDD